MTSAGNRSPEPVPFEVAPGTILDGKYFVERILGAGAMGTVVVAKHLHLEQRVALKFMHPAYTQDRSAVARFLQEAQAAASIQSDYVARVSDMGTLENGSPYLVMEYLRGQDLAEVLRVTSPLPVQDAVNYAMETCEGLAEAHAMGIVHRDLKPENLFLARNKDGSFRVKLLDFGISKLLPMPGKPVESRMTATQVVLGSPMYMAPEQMRASKNVDFRADIWSLGIILYEMLAGRAPFGGETLPVMCANILRETPVPLTRGRNDIPEELGAVVMRCLEKAPDRRFLDVAELAHALAPFAEEGASRAARIDHILRVEASSSLDELPPSSSEPVPRLPGPHSSTQTSAASETLPGWPTRRSRLMPLAVAVAALAAVVTLIILTTTSAPTASPSTTAAAAAPHRPAALPTEPARQSKPSATTTNTPPPLQVFRTPSGVPQRLSSGATPLGVSRSESQRVTAERVPIVAPVPTSPEAATLSHAPASVASSESRPTAKPKPAASAKPSSTSAFGGRD